MSLTVRPASSSHGDTIFTPHAFHWNNTHSSFAKGRQGHLHGSVLTSWTVRLNPWELQEPTIRMPGYLKDHPEATLEQYKTAFEAERFGRPCPTFWQACELLSPPCPFADAPTLGFHKYVIPAEEDAVVKVAAEWIQRGLVGERLASARECLAGYERGAAMLEALAGSVQAGGDLIEAWDWGARNLVNRARAAVVILASAEALVEGRPVDESARDAARALMVELVHLREETHARYGGFYQPTRCDHVVGWMYDSEIGRAHV